MNLFNDKKALMLIPVLSVLSFFYKNTFAASCIKIRNNGNLGIDIVTPVSDCATYVVLSANEFQESVGQVINITPEMLNGMLSVGFVLPVIATIGGMWVGTLFGAMFLARKI